MSAPSPLTLAWLNAAPADEALAALEGLYEHSPWFAEAALKRRPFATLAQLKHALVCAVRDADRDAQLALVRAHPELAGKAAVAGTLTAESTNEQAKAGLNQCTPEEFAKVQQLNAAYNARFGWPFVMAVRGPRASVDKAGLHRHKIIATVERRLRCHPDFELAEALRNIHRIAEIRINDKFGFTPTLGNLVWDWAEQLAIHSDASAPGVPPSPASAGEGRGEGDRPLTVTYLTPAHQACASQLAEWMRDCGFDEVNIDAVGNVVGVYRGAGEDPHPNPLPLMREREQDTPRPTLLPRRLLTGSHYDTVRNGGKYDGRIGIFVPMACVRELHRAGRRLPFGIEVVGFAEEEGQRYKATFLGSGALTGHFDPAWLDQTDVDGISMRAAMQKAGLPATMAAIAAVKRDAANYLGFVEVHIEQGPVLNELDLPLGVVTSINGSVRYVGEVVGVASHAGTTPMDRRRDAAAAVAEMIAFVEQRAGAVPHLVGTVGMLNVPSGSINVVPGRCSFSLDIRATTNDVRDACAQDVLAQLSAICERRGLSYTIEETMRAAAAPSAPAWQQRWERAVAATGLPVHRMPSGAGHDAMKLHEAMPQAMLFVRGENAGISHNPLESSTADDLQLAVEAYTHLLNELASFSSLSRIGGRGSG
jgi:N-carbamoyl-L-amino-acid hydrolase